MTLAEALAKDEHPLQIEIIASPLIGDALNVRRTTF